MNAIKSMAGATRADTTWQFDNAHFLNRLSITVLNNSASAIFCCTSDMVGDSDR